MRSDIDDHRRRVVLVEQGVWEFPKESLPLALGYLKAAAMADPEINSELSLSIRNFKGGTSLSEVAHDLFSGPIPDVLAFSVFGWNLWSFGSLAQTFRQLNPEGWVIFGGTHVAHGADRLFRLFPELDVVVNGEGEFVFIDLLHAYLKGISRRDLGDVLGISFKGEDGAVVTTAPRERITDLNQIPSPFLTKALEMKTPDGSFRYEVALMETNRGCPYRCAFCYWGGAIGQRIRSFSRERLREELDYLGFHGAETVVLCDANFGMLPSDEAFVDDVISTRDKYGFPRAIETSWAKNKSRVFRDVVRKMKSAGLKSSFTLALQSLNDDALRSMNRQNMKLNEWEELVKWLGGEGLDCYAELIWNTPGETIQSFLAGYDRLAKHVSRIAVYPLLLMPNTKYADNKDQYGLVTVRGEHDDFEYVLGHQSISMSEHVEMQPFLFWARSIAETSFYRYIWVPLRELGGMSQSQVLLNLTDWFKKSSDPIAAELASLQKRAINSDFLPEMVARLYSDSRLQALLDMWWTDAVLPILPAKCARFLSETYRFDCLSRPIHEDAAYLDSEIKMVELYGARYYVRRDLEFDYDVPAMVSALQSGLEVSLEPQPTQITLYFLVGVSEHIQSHEMVSHYVGKTIEQLDPSDSAPYGPESRNQAHLFHSQLSQPLKYKGRRHNLEPEPTNANDDFLSGPQPYEGPDQRKYRQTGRFCMNGKFSNPPMISVQNLVKNYGKTQALRGISFQVQRGEIFAFLGPNGAGKTTAIKILTTLLRPTTGRVEIDGLDVTVDQHAVRQRLGIVFQDSSLDEQLTVLENMQYHAVLYDVPRRARATRIEILIDVFGLWEYRHKQVRRLSGGLKRRVEVARGLIHNPKTLFLDEPTIGLDPQSRNYLWAQVKQLNEREDVTVFLTTHYMEEAERFAHRIAILDHGNIIAQGTAKDLNMQTHSDTLEDSFIALTGHEVRSEDPGKVGRMRQLSQLGRRK